MTRRFKKIHVFVFLVAFLIIVSCLVLNANPSKILCVPDITGRTIAIEAQNADIIDADAKYGKLISRQESEQKWVFYVDNSGTEYIHVDYIDATGNSRYTTFEVVVSVPGYLVTVAQLDEAGNQIDFHAY